MSNESFARILQFMRTGYWDESFSFKKDVTEFRKWWNNEENER